MIVDNDKILAELKVQYDSYNSIVIPLYSDIKKHRLNNRLSLLYIYILDTKKTFIILANHSDKLFNVDSLSFLNNDRIKYTYSTEIKNAVNIDALYYMSNLCNINKEELYTDSHTFFYNKYWKLDNVNDIIPVLKHIEYYDKIKDKILKVIDNENKIGFNEYNNKVIKVFRNIENAGLATYNGYEFTKYNLWTITGRPSNSFNGINYAALNKEDGTREKYISRFDKGKLVELDFDAYHLRLIAKMIGYDKIPDNSFHTYLGQYYFGKTIITKDEYNESKAVSFKILYGGVPKEFENIPYFSKVKQYIFDIWDIYKSNGYFETPIFKRKVHAENLEGRDLKPQTLFNYMIQAMETEQNVLIIESIHKMLKEYQSKLILYTYDALLFDIHPDEIHLLNNIKELMIYAVKCKTGHNYNKIEAYNFE